MSLLQPPLLHSSQRHSFAPWRYAKQHEKPSRALGTMRSGSKKCEIGQPWTSRSKSRLPADFVMFVAALWGRSRIVAHFPPIFDFPPPPPEMADGRCRSDTAADTMQRLSPRGLRS